MIVFPRPVGRTTRVLAVDAVDADLYLILPPLQASTALTTTYPLE